MNTFAEVLNFCESEEKAIQWLSFIRWGQWAKCPHCGNNKAYFIEKGTRYKCAFPACHKKFSISSLTLLSSTNLAYKDWIIAGIAYVNSRGRLHSYELEKEIKINAKTALIMKDKFDFAWKYIDKADKDKISLLKELFYQLFNLYAFYEQFQQNKYNTSYHISNITDINDPTSFDKLLNYIKIRMFFCSYIYLEFCSPGEVMTEVFLYMHDNKIKDYNADFIIKIINRTISKMWSTYRKAHPNLLAVYLKNQKENKRKRIRNLSKSYIIDLIQNSKLGKTMTRTQIKNDSELIESTKIRIAEGRKKNNYLSDFNSHFD